MNPEHNDMPQGITGPEAYAYLKQNGAQVNSMEFGKAFTNLTAGSIVEFDGKEGRIAIQLALDGSGKFNVIEAGKAVE